VVICLERGAGCLHMVQLMPYHLLPHLNPDWLYLSVYQPAYPGCPAKEAVKPVCVCVCVCFSLNRTVYIIKLARVYIGCHSDMNADKKLIIMCVVCDECLH